MKDKITYGEKYGPAMEMTTQAEADAYFEELVQHTMKFNHSKREQAEAIERSNLGYYAGYYDSKTRTRVEQLFKCAHPIFGKLEAKSAPTVQQALNAGLQAAALHKNQN